MKRILFLCMGNICRSPAAHCVFQHLVHQAGLTDQFEIESAGTTGYHVGSAPDPRMQDVMRARKIPIIGTSRRLTADDLEHYDLIVAMDSDNFNDARQLDSRGDFHEKIVLFGTYCTRHRITDVPDPYYGIGGFDHVLDLIEDGCAELLEQLKR